MNRYTMKGVAAGLIAGMLIGATGLAVAAIPKRKWVTLSQDFQIGYITGFMDCSQIARNENPWGSLDRTFPFWPQAKTLHWYDAVTKVFQRKESEGWTILDAMASAAQDLRKRFGRPPTPMERLSPMIRKSMGVSDDEVPKKDSAKAAAAPKRKPALTAEEQKAAAEARAKEWAEVSPLRRKAEEAAEHAAEVKEAAERKARAAEKAAQRAARAKERAARAAEALTRENQQGASPAGVGK